jgi:hypothetical protein
MELYMTATQLAAATEDAAETDKPTKRRRRKGREGGSPIPDTAGRLRLAFERRRELQMHELRATVDSDNPRGCEPYPPNILPTPPVLTAKRAVRKFGHTLDEFRRPSSWDLALDSIDCLLPGSLVLSDVSIGAIPECSVGVFVEMQEAYLAQVVFEPKSGGSKQCLVVPLECLCTPGQAHDNIDSDDSFSYDMS